MSKTTDIKAVIQIGSVVQLKSGGPKMTITGADTFKGTLTLVWATANERLSKADLPAAALKIVKA